MTASALAAERGIEQCAATALGEFFTAWATAQQPDPVALLPGPRHAQFSVVNGQLFLSGVLTGTATLADGTRRQITQVCTTEAPVSLRNPTQAVCDSLCLDSGPISLDRLGLTGDLSQIGLDSKAVAGPGQLLGHLLCALVGLLDEERAGVEAEVRRAPLALRDRRYLRLSRRLIAAAARGVGVRPEAAPLAPAYLMWSSAWWTARYRAWRFPSHAADWW